MPKIPEKSIETFFEQMEDHRHHNKLHNLIDIIIIAICAVVSGADTYEQIENFGKSVRSGFPGFYNYPMGYLRMIPLVGYLKG